MTPSFTVNNEGDESFNDALQSALRRQRLIVAARLAALQSPIMGELNVSIQQATLLPAELQGPPGPSIAHMLDQLRLAQQQQLFNTASLPSHLDSAEPIMQQRQLALLNDRERLLQQSNSLPSRSALQMLGSPMFSSLSRDTSIGGMSSSDRGDEKPNLLSSSSSDVQKFSTLELLTKKHTNNEAPVNPLHLKKKTFAESVYLMLQEQEEEHNGAKAEAGVISYVANGAAFMIHKPGAFETDIMPLYFKSTRMASFQRQLAIYGFKRIERGPYRGAYQHEHFHRDKPELLPRIIRPNNVPKMKGVLQKKEKSKKGLAVKNSSRSSSPLQEESSTLSQASTS